MIVDDILTMPAPIPQQAATARMLKTAEPTMVPTPISPSVMNVPITLTKSSGAEVAAAMKVAPATSADMFSAAKYINLDNSDYLISHITNSQSLIKLLTNS